MDRLMKKTAVVFALALIFLVVAPSAFAEPAIERVFDDAKALSERQKDALNQACSVLAANCDVDFAILIRAGASEEWNGAADSVAYGEDGEPAFQLPLILLTIDPEARRADLAWAYNNASSVPPPDEMREEIDWINQSLADGSAWDACVTFIECMQDKFLFGDAPLGMPDLYDTNVGIAFDAQAAAIMRGYIPEGRQAEDFVFDEANIFTQREEEAIRSHAQFLFEQYSTNFIVVTGTDTVGSPDDLAGYSEQFHNERLGLGWDDCAVMLTIDMGLREYRVDFFGKGYHLLSSDEDTLPVTDGIYDYMAGGDYLDAYMVFCDKARIWFDQYVEEQRATTATDEMLQSIDYPARSLYVQPGIGEDAALARVEALFLQNAEAVQAGFMAVVTSGHDYSRENGFKNRFSDAARKQCGEADGAILFLDTGTDTIAIDRWGAAEVQYRSNDEIWIDDAMQERLRQGDTAAAVEIFLGTVADTVKNSRLIENMELPAMSGTQFVYDLAGALSGGQVEQLEEQARARAEADGVDYLVVICALEPEADWLADWYLEDIAKQEAGREGAFLLVADIQNGRAVSTYWGERPNGKIVTSRWRDTVWQVESMVRDGDIAGGAEKFIVDMSNGMRSIIPKAIMVKYASEYFSIALLIGLALTGIGMLVLVIMNLSANGRKMQAGSYMRTGSFHLDYARDVFLHTHTSRVRKAESNSSGGGGGARPGGSSSSRGSQRSF